jgi:anaerobic magnesium-protoporphyrin IX monomethyl ester cyclase
LRGSDLSPSLDFEEIYGEATAAISSTEIASANVLKRPRNDVGSNSKQNIMNIILIQPTVQDFYFTPIRSFPLGLCYLAGELKKAGHVVSILDLLQGGKRARSAADERFDYLRPYYDPSHLSPFGMFKHFQHYGMPFDGIKEIIAKNNADVFAISSLFSAYADQMIMVTRIIKEIHPESIVVCGGSHAHSYARELLQEHKSIDYIVLGEGERTLLDLVRSFKDPARVPGIAYRKDREIIVNQAREEKQHLDAIAWPARDLLDLDAYRIHGKRYTPLITTRGCPLACSFCSIPQFAGRKLRHRAIDDICQEIIHCYDKLNIRIFDIEDDNFTFDSAWAKEFLTSLIHRLGDRTIEITAMNGLYYQSLDKELLSLLQAAGMRRLNLSLVAQSRSTSARMNRSLDVKGCEDIVLAAKERGMHVTLYFIIGLPGETIDDMLGSLTLLAGLPVLIGPSIYYHVPGSDLFSDLEDKGVVAKDDYPFFRSTAMFYEDEHFDRTDIATIFRLTRIINFMKSFTGKELWVTIPDDIVVTDKALSQHMIGLLLLKAFLKDREIYSYVRSRTEGKIRYSLVKEMTSRRVIDRFFEQSRDLLVCPDGDGQEIIFSRLQAHFQQYK